MAFHRAPTTCTLHDQLCHARGEMRSFQPRARPPTRRAALQGLGCAAGVKNFGSARRGNPKHANPALAALAARAGGNDLHRLSRSGERTHTGTHKSTRRVVRTAGIRGTKDADHVGGSSARAPNGLTLP